MATSLSDLVKSSGLKFVQVDERTVAVPFQAERADRVIVQVRALDEKLAIFATTLPEVPMFGKEAALRCLVRTSFSANYVKAVSAASGGLLMAAEVPTETLTPEITEGLVRGLVHLGDIKKKDLADEDGWTSRARKCTLAQASHITVDKDEVRQQVLQMAAAAGVDIARQDDEVVVLEVKVAGQELKVVVRPMPLVVSSIAFLGGVAPKGDKKKYLEKMLELNRTANVAKLGLDKDGEVALLYEVPRIFPGFLQQLTEQFTALLFGVITLHTAQG